MVNVTEPLEKEAWEVSEQWHAVSCYSEEPTNHPKNVTLWQMILSVKDTD